LQLLFRFIPGCFKVRNPAPGCFEVTMSAFTVASHSVASGFLARSWANARSMDLSSDFQSFGLFGRICFRHRDKNHCPIVDSQLRACHDLVKFTDAVNLNDSLGNAHR